MKPKQFFKATWRKSSLLFSIFSMMVICTAAQVNISGKVTDETGKPAPNITILIKGTSRGSSTDNDGNYHLSAALKPGNYTVAFSGVGFESKDAALSVGSSLAYTLDAVLTTKISKLDEVIVTGTSAGTTRRQLGSYISSVNADELTKGATANVLASLQGKTAGAQITQNNGDPAGGLSVRLRGISSISSSSEPLYIIDGVIVNNATNRVTNTQSGYDGS